MRDALDPTSVFWLYVGVGLILTSVVMAYYGLKDIIHPVLAAIPVITDFRHCNLHLPHDPHAWSLEIQCPGVAHGSEKPEGT